MTEHQFLVSCLVVGMIGMLSGPFFSPLTAIFLSAEVTNGYTLFIPLMLLAAISFFEVKSFDPLSLEIKKLFQHSELDPTDKDRKKQWQTSGRFPSKTG